MGDVVNACQVVRRRHLRVVVVAGNITTMAVVDALADVGSRERGGARWTCCSSSSVWERRVAVLRWHPILAIERVLQRRVTLHVPRWLRLWTRCRGCYVAFAVAFCAVPLRRSPPPRYHCSNGLVVRSLLFARQPTSTCRHSVVSDRLEGTDTTLFGCFVCWENFYCNGRAKNVISGASAIVTWSPIFLFLNQKTNESPKLDNCGGNAYYKK